MGGLLGGSLQRGRWIISVCSVSLKEIGFLSAGWYNGRNWLATGWMGRTDGPDGTGFGTGTVWRDRRWQAPRERHNCLLRCAWQLEAVGGSGKRWLQPICLVLQGRRLFVPEHQNNPNRLHTNPNWNVVHDSINNTYDTILLWLHTNLNF